MQSFLQILLLQNFVSFIIASSAFFPPFPFSQAAFKIIKSCHVTNTVLGKEGDTTVPEVQQVISDHEGFVTGLLSVILNLAFTD